MNDNDNNPFSPPAARLVDPTPTPRAFPTILVLRWLLGLYLLGGCVLGAAAIISNLATVQQLMESAPYFNIYPMILGWLLKLASGILLLVRSKWLLVSIPAWIVVFIFDFFSRNTFLQLPPEFFLAVAIQLGLLFFVLWLHGRGRLK